MVEAGKPLEEFGISLDGPLKNFVYPIYKEHPSERSAFKNLSQVRYSGRKFLREISLSDMQTGEPQMPFGLTKAEYVVSENGELESYKFIIRPDKDDKGHQAIASIARGLSKTHPDISYTDSLYMLFPTVLLTSDAGLEFIVGIEGYNDEAGPPLSLKNNGIEASLRVNEFVASMLEVSEDPFGPRIARLNDKIPPYSFEIKTFGGVSELEGIVPVAIEYDLLVGLNFAEKSFDELDIKIRDLICSGELTEEAIFQIVHPYARIISDDLSRA